MNGSAIRSSLKVPWREDQMKKSSSNENLRKSYLATKRVSAFGSSSSQSGSVQDGGNKGQVSIPIPDKPVIKIPVAEDIVEIFIKQEKSSDKSKPEVVVEVEEESMTSPVKLPME